MNDLDRAIVATLRAEAREAEMRTDTPLQYEELSSRLDDVDRSRTRTRWLAAAAAVAAVGLGAWLLSGFGHVTSAPPVTPGPATSSPSVAPILADAFNRQWTTTVSLADFRAALVGTAYEGKERKLLDQAYDGIGTAATADSRWRLDLYLVGGHATLYLVPTPGAEPVMVDSSFYELGDGGRVSTQTAAGKGVQERAVYDVTATQDSLRFAWVSGSVTGAVYPGPEADLNTAFRRAFLTATTWRPAT